MSPQKKISIFLFLTFAFSSLSYIPIIRAGTIGIQGGLFVFTMMWSPGLAAILTQFITTRSFRGLGWRPGQARWLGLAYILPAAYALPVYAFTWLTGLGTFPDPVRIARLAEEYSTSNLPSILTIYVFSSLTIGMLENLISGLGEEIGWRGLLVPELAKVTSFTKTALISGIVWAAWHMPAIFLADLNDSGTPNAYAAAMYAVMLIAISFPFAWLTLKSRSLWPAALLHASHNLFVQWIFDRLTADTNITPYITGEFGVGLAVASLVVAYVFWHTQRNKALQNQLIVAQAVFQSD
jgi:membrane protease YdiL (CAAX protease family)